MCNQRLEKIETLLSHMEFASGVDRSKVDLTAVSSDEESTEQGFNGSGHSVSMSIADWDSTFEAEFELALTHYIQQPGHPDDNGVRGLVGSRYESEADDRLLRARLFLAFMTGSDLVPIEDTWNIKVSMSFSLSTLQVD